MLVTAAVSLTRVFSLPGSCRYYPSCSEYAHAALQMHGARRAVLLIAARLLRCNPIFRGGYDPVPDRDNQ
ncbi:MAG: membrane protein insertion efficiency factor YidD [Chitinivibrionales bacterium]|nr:membrane protein insertion efficiency factor YidD [Chitinivibrionales bacterium]